MVEIRRLGLGCMGMSNRRNPERSIKTIRTALENGITLFNTGEFYNAGESEMIVGEAMRGVPRDSYFLSVKFGVLPQPGGGIYGLDVDPFHIPGHLAYSLSRLGTDHVDLYQPARQDTAIPVEEVVGAISRLVEAGYVRHIGLSMVDADTLRRACKVHPIHTVEMSYSLIDRSIETELIDTARELGVKVLAFGTIGHGLFADHALDAAEKDPRLARGMFSPEQKEATVSMLQALQSVAAEKGIGLSQLALAWSLAKYEHVQSLVGTTDPAHLQSAIDALQIEFSKEDLARIEAAIPLNRFGGRGMRNFRFTHGRMDIPR